MRPDMGAGRPAWFVVGRFIARRNTGDESPYYKPRTGCWVSPGKRAARGDEPYALSTAADVKLADRQHDGLQQVDVRRQRRHQDRGPDQIFNRHHRLVVLRLLG